MNCFTFNGTPWFDLLLGLKVTAGLTRNSYIQFIVKDDGKKWAGHSIALGNIWPLLPCFIWFFNQKIIITASLGRPCPHLLATFIFQNRLYNLFFSGDLFSIMQPLSAQTKPVPTQSLFPSKMLRWVLAPSVETFTTGTRRVISTTSKHLSK